MLNTIDNAPHLHNNTGTINYEKMPITY